MVTVNGFDIFINNSGCVVVSQEHIGCPKPIVVLTEHDVQLLIDLLPKYLKEAKEENGEI